jgi:ABC-type uncharacterized transport system substrate-binding protein
MNYRWAEGYVDRLSALAQELVRLKADVIVTANIQATVAMKEATKTIPIIGVLLDDPVGLGLIKSDAKPGGNVTGLLSSLPGLPAKQLELARDLIAGASRIGLLVNPTNVSDLSQRQEMETAGAAMALTLIPVETRRRLRGQDTEGRRARRSAGRVSDQTRARDQSANRQGARPQRATDAPRARRRGD